MRTAFLRIVLPAALAAAAVVPGAAIAAADSSDLPAVAVTPHVIHPVPEGGLPATPPPPLPASRAAPPPMPRRAAILPHMLAGPAQPLSGVRLSLLGRAIRLFGVRMPEPRDLCTLRSGPAQPCAEVAREALAMRLAVRPGVTCQAPPGQRGEPGFVCRDAIGTDLGDFLVAQGLAIADTRQSYRYFNAEGGARAGRRGLWRYR